MNRFVRNYNIPSIVILIYVFFLAWRSPGSATLIPAIGSILIFLFYGKFNLRLYISLLTVSISMLILALFQSEDITGLIKVLSCFMAFFLMKRLSKEVSLYPQKTFNSTFRRLIWLVVAYLSLEAILRMFYGHLFYDASLANSLDYEMQDLFRLGIFYRYKNGSPFFTDSNFAGIFLFVWFLVFIHFKEAIFLKKHGFILSFLFFTLAIFTFSRALYATVILVYFGFKLFDKLDKFRTLPIFLVIGLIIVVFWPLLDSIATSDGSLQTKLFIWQSLIANFMKFDLFSQLFGFGLIEGKYVFSYEVGKTAHALIPQLVGDIGLIGSIIYLSILALVFLRVKNGLLYFVAIMLIGASLFDPWDPVFFAIMGIFSAVPNVNKIRNNYP